MRHISDALAQAMDELIDTALMRAAYAKHYPENRGVASQAVKNHFGAFQTGWFSAIAALSERAAEPAKLYEDPNEPVRCGRCCRKSWSHSEGAPCDFPQPAGGRCVGIFSRILSERAAEQPAEPLCCDGVNTRAACAAQPSAEPEGALTDAELTKIVWKLSPSAKAEAVLISNVGPYDIAKPTNVLRELARLILAARTTPAAPAVELTDQQANVAACVNSWLESTGLMPYQPTPKATK